MAVYTSLPPSPSGADLNCHLARQSSRYFSIRLYFRGIPQEKRERERGRIGGTAFIADFCRFSVRAKGESKIQAALAASLISAELAHFDHKCARFFPRLDRRGRIDLRRHTYK